MRVLLPSVFLALLWLAEPAHGATTFTVAAADLPNPLVLIAYGDMRFTDRSEKLASSPTARQALVEKIAAENPAAIFINGDIPWHGIPEDYREFLEETHIWRDRRVRVYPALGNHEFSACFGSACLDHWWSAFPELRGHRWYSVAIGPKVVGIALDSDTSLLPDSEQRIWLEQQITTLKPEVRVVMLIMHHPPVADVQTTKVVDHNPRPNEQTLVSLIKAASAKSAVRFVVSAGHIHNYERFEQDGAVYLVSGGGGASPYPVDRTPSDLYQDTDFPNYHYVRFELHDQVLKGEMVRLNDFAAAHPSQWQTRDRFEINLRP
jgi:acid phosphatase type 7